MYTQYEQVTGGASRLVLCAESAPGVPGARGIVMPIASESLSAGTNKQNRSVIDGKRGSGKPFRGLPSPAGTIAMGASAPHMGHIFRALCGVPGTDEVMAVFCSAGPVQDLSGEVFISTGAHNFRPGDTVSIIGTGHYDGTHVLTKQTSAAGIAFVHAYTAESVPATARVVRGRTARLVGAAVNAGGGKVLFPVSTTGGAHCFHVGDRLAVHGSSSYADTYTVSDVTASSVTVYADFAEETMDAVAIPVFYSHRFVLPLKQPTQTWEKHFSYDDGAAANEYRRYSCCKINGLSFDAGGDGELLLTIEVSAGSSAGYAVPLVETPENPPKVYIDKPDMSLFVAGERRGEVSTAAFTANFGIEPKNAVGDGLNYTRMPEGTPEVTLGMSCFLENDWMQQIADADAVVPVMLYGCGLEGDAFAVLMPECVLDTGGAAISGDEGLMLNVTARAFVDSAESILVFDLINRVASYA